MIGAIHLGHLRIPSPMTFQLHLNVIDALTTLTSGIKLREICLGPLMPQLSPLKLSTSTTGQKYRMFKAHW